MVECAKCGYSEIQSEIHLHHLVPKALGGTDNDGRRYLCKKCHDILHNMLIKRIWKFVNAENEAKKDIKNFSLWWINSK